MSTQPQLKRFADVTVDSAGQDGFTHAHNALVRVTPSIPGGPIKRLSPFTVECITETSSDLTMGLSHGGGTQLSTDMTHWTALDAGAVNGFWECTIIVPDPFDPVITIGGPITSVQMDLGIKSTGGGSAGSGGYSFGGYSTARTSSNEYGGFGGAILGPTAIPGLVRYFEGPGGSHNIAPAYKGIKTYYDVAAYAKTPPNQVDPANFAPALTIEVEKKSAQIRTAAQVLPGNNMLKLNDALKGNVMHALATSQAYFMRPEHADHRKLLNGSYVRTDNKTEYASLYNPYWQTRLVTTPQLLVDGSTAAQ